MAGQNIDAAFAAILKDCQAIAAEAVKNSAKKVQNDVLKEADDYFELSAVGIIDHPVELCAFFGGGTGNSFVSIDFIQFPIRMPLNIRTEITLL